MLCLMEYLCRYQCTWYFVLTVARHQENLSYLLHKSNLDFLVYALCIMNHYYVFYLPRHVYVYAYSYS